MLLPRRWVVERTFAWLVRYRRLSKEYEGTSREAMVQIAMIHLMTHHLRPRKLKRPERFRYKKGRKRPV